MKKKLAALAYPALAGALAGYVLMRPQQASRAALAALTTFAAQVAPALFPMLACALMLSGARACVALAWLSGSPGGARLLLARKPSGAYAVRLAAWTGVMSPSFLLQTSAAWLGCARAGAPMLVSHLASAYLVGLCVRVPGGARLDRRAGARMPPGEAVREAALAMLSVAGYMVLGAVAAELARAALSGAALAALLTFLEVTSGARMLAELALPLPLRAALVCAACSFGGMSILLQNAAYLRPLGIHTGKLLLLRALHAFVSLPVCYLLCVLCEL